ncbi:MAG: dihydrodipicolinate synthase family protein [Phycisphaerae bacterium]|jgi:dihydrodipicolinate synthase/N-acetylneuraminate lyase|nr:dihydrodipicolinate synthase family protein [Phycisphaerae bacterium]MDP7636722.1 dihydrodipicolinate synthase family protein [Phycisphaerae bacterium]
MARLTAEELRGIWAGVTMVWDEDYRFDEQTYAENIERMIAAGVYGLYTTGSTGEFYVIEYDEFCRMVDIEAELCGRAQKPLQIGCCSDATAKTIKLLEYAADKKEVGAAQINIPYWMKLTDRELLQFFKDLHTACPDMPLVHYNIPRTKRFLNAPDYLRILEVAPNLIGVKYTFAGSHFGQLQDSIMMTPNLSYFVGESLLASAMQLGARGSYSSLIATDPRFVLKMYALAESHQWDQAIEMQKRLAEFCNDCAAFVSRRDEVVMDPVFDKGLAVAAGCLLGHQRCRPPYIGWSDQTIADLRVWLKEDYPEFVYPDN